jgi:hypothetical protein
MRGADLAGATGRAKARASQGDWQVGLALDQPSSAMEQSTMRVGALLHLATEFNNKKQHPLRRRVLRLIIYREVPA